MSCAERALDSPAGSVLQSESEMSAEFGASRVTIRRALELVREDGLIAARQGFGWFVATEPVPQSLSSLATIESHVEGVGKLSERKVEEFAYVSAPERVARDPGCGSGAARQAGESRRR
jgi:GntR family transcriptional regulator